MKILYHHTYFRYAGTDSGRARGALQTDRKKALSDGDVREGLAKSLKEESRQSCCNTAIDAQQVKDFPIAMHFLHHDDTAPKPLTLGSCAALLRAAKPSGCRSAPVNSNRAHDQRVFSCCCCVRPTNQIDQPQQTQTGPSPVTMTRWHAPRRGAGVVERGGLENRCGRKSTEGSNPSLSAISQ